MFEFLSPKVFAALGLPPKSFTEESKIKPSFDCSAISKDDERKICSNDELARLDNEVVDRYKRYLGSLTAVARSDFVRDQRAWLDVRNRCGNDTQCLTARYQERIKQLAK